MRQEPGKWAPLNSRAIIASVRRVFEQEDIDALTEQAYKHITGQVARKPTIFSRGMKCHPTVKSVREHSVAVRACRL
jgi:hypothetical protein